MHGRISTFPLFGLPNMVMKPDDPLPPSFLAADAGRVPPPSFTPRGAHGSDKPEYLTPKSFLVIYSA